MKKLLLGLGLGLVGVMPSIALVSCKEEIKNDGISKMIYFYKGNVDNYVGKLNTENIDDGKRTTKDEIVIYVGINKINVRPIKFNAKEYNIDRLEGELKLHFESNKGE